jgi:hypothetical protein
MGRISSRARTWAGWSGTARPVRASGHVGPSILGTLGMLGRAGWHKEIFPKPKHGPWPGGPPPCHASPSTALTYLFSSTIGNIKHYIYFFLFLLLLGNIFSSF